MFLKNKDLYFESVSDFKIIVPNKKCFPSKKGLLFESISDFIIFILKFKCSLNSLKVFTLKSVSDFMILSPKTSDLGKTKKKGVCTWNLSSISGGISVKIGRTEP